MDSFGHEFCYVVILLCSLVILTITVLSWTLRFVKIHLHNHRYMCLSHLFFLLVFHDKEFSGTQDRFWLWSHSHVNHLLHTIFIGCATWYVLVRLKKLFHLGYNSINLTFFFSWRRVETACREARLFSNRNSLPRQESH